MLICLLQLVLSVESLALRLQACSHFVYCDKSDKQETKPVAPARLTASKNNHQFLWIWFVQTDVNKRWICQKLGPVLWPGRQEVLLCYKHVSKTIDGDVSWRRRPDLYACFTYAAHTWYTAVWCVLTQRPGQRVKTEPTGRETIRPVRCFWDILTTTEENRKETLSHIKLTSSLVWNNFWCNCFIFYWITTVFPWSSAAAVIFQIQCEILSHGKSGSVTD